MKLHLVTTDGAGNYQFIGDFDEIQFLMESETFDAKFANVKIVATMRADFFDKLDNYSELVEATE